MLADPTRSVPDVAAVPSQATVSGLQALTQTSAGDAALKGARNVFEITSAMVQYPIVGATTVMDLAIGYTGFDPTNWEKEGNYDAFLKYVQEIVTAPFFHLNYADYKELHHREESWETLVGSIAELFEGVVGEEKDRIARGLTQLAHRATTVSETAQKLNTFFQQVLSANNSSITLGIYYSTVAMVKKDGKHSTYQADYKVSRALLNFNLELWPNFAHMVAQTKYTSVQKWLERMNSIN